MLYCLGRQRSTQSALCHNTRSDVADQLFMSFCRALAAQQQQAATEEQHNAARRHREGRFSSVAPSSVGTDKPRHDHHQQVSPAVNNPDDEWLASLEPHLQALLIKKQPVCLTRADHLEARYCCFTALLHCNFETLNDCMSSHSTGNRFFYM